jgi:hypothetical protein
VDGEVSLGLLTFSPRAVHRSRVFAKFGDQAARDTLSGTLTLVCSTTASTASITVPLRFERPG